MKIDAARSYIAESLRFAFSPRRIAVVGASRQPNEVGFEVVKALLDRHYGGEILPVNADAPEIQGLPAYKDVRSISGPIDLAFLAVPAGATLKVVEECAEKGAHAVAVASGGFRESGNADLEGALVRCCRTHQMALLGPNFLALGNPHANFSCGLAPYVPAAGSLAAISQSGANLLAILGASTTGAFGLSFFVGLGNKADVDFSELIEYAGRDSHTRCVALYVEGLDSEDAFVASCRDVAPRKPILVLKAGTSMLGWSAAMAHTGSNAGTVDNRTGQLFRRAGAIRVRTLEELMDGALALTLMPPLKGENIAIVTNGGGSGLLMADEFERRGMALRELKQISPRLYDRIAKMNPKPSSCLNPIDLGCAAGVKEYCEAVSQLSDDPDIHGAVVSICPTLLTPVRDIALKLAECFDASPKSKPVVVEIQGGADCDAAILELRRRGIPAYSTPERAVAAFSVLRRYTLQRYEMQQPVSMAATAPLCVPTGPPAGRPLRRV